MGSHAPLSALRWGLLLVALATSGAFAQQLGPPIPDELRRLMEEAGAKAAGQAAPAPKQAAAPPKQAGPSPLLQAYLKLKFDRRPASILTAQAAPAEVTSTTPAAPNTSDPAWITSQSQRFSRAVTLGDYPKLRELLGVLPAAEAAKAQQHVLRNLAQAPDPRRPRPKPGKPSLDEDHLLGVADLVGLIDAAPAQPSPETLALLAPLIKLSLRQGHDLDALVDRWLRGSRWLGGAEASRRHAAGRVLLAAEQPQAVEPFLPAPGIACGEPHPEHLKLLVETYEALYRADSQTAVLEAAWALNLVLLGRTDLEPEPRHVATVRAVDLAARLEEARGAAWLQATFTAAPEQGMSVLAAVGRNAASARKTLAKEPEQRLRSLRLQQEVVEALLEHHPQRADAWQPTLDLLAQNWLAEAEYSAALSKGKGQVGGWRYDRYGNLYFPQDNRRDPRQPDPIDPGDLLERVPGPLWRARIHLSLRARFLAAAARLALKGYGEADAFSWIEQLAAADPEAAHELTEAFVTAWTQRHDPNSQQRQRNPYISIWGFQRRMSGIPLTRSKQEQNLHELAEWAAKIRALPIEPIDERLLAGAFMRAHSQAEVYRLDALERVFGSVAGLAPGTLAELVQTMRTNLGSVWRDPKVQDAKKTQRKDKEIQAQVLRGYEQASQLLQRGLAAAPHDWELLLARATVRHDHNVYLRYDVASSTDFSAARKAAFADFAAAAKAYSEAAGDLPEDERSVAVYQRWLYASLGASDLEKVAPQHTPDPKQPAAIRAALEELGPDAKAWHRERLASDLFTRMGAVNPAVKGAYLRAGFAVIGEHPAAREAQAVLDYYADLVHEIQLEAQIDGSDRVGHALPFGVLVSIRHTEHIERESGGFGKYLQNQNAQRFAYNYGRPLANYRDKFEESTREALAEHFDVLSVTFSEPDVESRGDPEPGWRVTPYAYLLLQARGPEVDTLPALSLDLDFIDTSGYVVLPVASPRVPVDARPERGDPRPLDELELVQTLDERQAGEGKLVLEVRAKGRGLIPRLEDVLDLAPPGFQVGEVEDQQVSAAELDPSGDEVAIRSERSWTIVLRGEEGLQRLPRIFEFGTPKLSDATATYQRYVDADLEEVEASVDLEAEYGAEETPWGGFVLLLLVVGGLGVGGLLWARQAPEVSDTAARFPVPEQLTPFTALAYLARLRADAPFSAADAKALDEERATLERAHFGPDAKPDDGALQALAERWSKKAGAVGSRG